MISIDYPHNKFADACDDFDLLSAIFAWKFNIIFTLALGYDIMKSVLISLFASTGSRYGVFWNGRIGKETDRGTRKELHNEEESIGNDAFTGNVF